MSAKKLLILSCLLASNFAHASFQASFSSVPVVIAAADGKPLANIRVQYSVSATGKGTCRNSDSIFDFGHSCPTNVEITKPQFVVTDANGRAVVPAVTASSKVWAEKEPTLNIFPQGVVVNTKDSSGKPVVCSMALTIDWKTSVNNQNVDLKITEEVSKQLTNKSLVFKHFYNLQDLTEFYLKNADAIVNREIKDYGDEGLHMNNCK